MGSSSDWMPGLVAERADLLLRAGCRVRVQIAQRVLQTGQPVLQNGRIPERLVPMPKRTVEDTALSVRMDPAQGEVVVGPVLPVLLRGLLQHPQDALRLRH